MERLVTRPISIRIYYVFENYPIQDSLSNNDGRLQISDVRSIQETNYPLGVVILPGRRIVRDVSSRPHPLRRVRHHPLFYALLSSLDSLPRLALDARVGDLCVLPDSEYVEVVESWNASERPYPREASLVELSRVKLRRFRMALRWRMAGSG